MSDKKYFALCFTLCALVLFGCKAMSENNKFKLDKMKIERGIK